MTNAPLKRFYIYLNSGKTFTGYATLKALSDFKMRMAGLDAAAAVLVFRDVRDQSQIDSLWLRCSQIEAIEIPDIGDAEKILTLEEQGS